jgi:DNA-binding MarR family transcriptional regulator
VLRLTAAGWKIHEAIAPLARDHERRLLAHLSVSEQRWLDRILNSLANAELSEFAR